MQPDRAGVFANALTDLINHRLGQNIIEQEITIRLWQSLAGETHIEHRAPYLRTATNSAISNAIRCSQARENSRRAENADVDQRHLFQPVQPTSVKQNTSERQLHDLVSAALAKLPENVKRATE